MAEVEFGSKEAAEAFVPLDGQGIICRRSGKAFFESGMLQRDQIASFGDHTAVGFFP